MRRTLAIALLITGLVGVGADLWVRKTFGVFVPWETPGRIDVCGGRYHPSVPIPGLDPGKVVRIHATFFALPVPLPDLVPTNAALPFAGCPTQLELVVGERVIAYGPPEGGP